MHVTSCEFCTDCACQLFGSFVHGYISYLGIFRRFRRTFAEVIMLIYRSFSARIVAQLFNCQCSKSVILFLCNINITSLLWLHVGMHIMYLSIYQMSIDAIIVSMRRALHTGSRNEYNIGAACSSP